MDAGDVRGGSTARRGNPGTNARGARRGGIPGDIWFTVAAGPAGEGIADRPESCRGAPLVVSGSPPRFRYSPQTRLQVGDFVDDPGHMPIPSNSALRRSLL